MAAMTPVSDRAKSAALAFASAACFGGAAIAWLTVAAYVAAGLSGAIALLMTAAGIAEVLR